METLAGVKTVEGMALAPAFPVFLARPTSVSTTSFDYQNEFAKLSLAIEEVKQLIQLRSSTGSQSQQEIFTAHLMMLEDPELQAGIDTRIKSGQFATVAVEQATNEFAEMLSGLADAYLQERAVDVKDIGQQIVNAIQGNLNPLAGINQECILVTEELTPSLVSDLDSQFVKGVISERGGPTSHAAILLKNRQIPAVFGIQKATQLLDKKNLFVDGSKGLVHFDFSQDEHSQFLIRQSDWMRDLEKLNKLKNIEAVTKCGQKIGLAANINSLSDVEKALENGADGVGLMRTEFLFFDNQLPDEEAQFKIYKNILQSFSGREVIIRTLDIGGDKPLPYLKIEKEDNPFLGLRGLRLSLQEQNLFRMQLRALLRAAAFGKLAVMFPMVTEVSEVIEAKKILCEERSKLETQGTNFGNFTVGIMVEVPACALQIDDFMSEVDFFSIGTNDLTQYVCAVDRLNSSVSNLYHYNHKALHRLLKMVADAGHKHSKKVSLCGEMAGQSDFTLLLLQLGIENFSVSPGNMLRLKDSILNATIN